MIGKVDITVQYSTEKEDERILLAKILDKQRFCLSKNKVTYSDFLNPKEKAIIQKNLNLRNYFFYGVCDNADREVLVFFPEKMNEELAINALKSEFTIVRVELPNNLKGEYEHRDYLSVLMRMGMTREKIGDILVFPEGADIIAFTVNRDYIIQSLGEFTRFKKARIYEVSLGDIREKEEKFEERTIIVASMRIDNFVAELVGCSRNKSEEFIDDERVYINYELVTKNSKFVNIGDIVNIRGKGKFIIDGLVRNTRNDRNVIKVRKFA